MGFLIYILLKIKHIPISCYATMSQTTMLKLLGVLQVAETIKLHV